MSLFKTVPAAKVPRSKFNLSHNRKLSCKIGELVPVLCQECIPGDEWKITSEAFARLAPMVAPPMHKIEIFFHGFFVPMRIIYEKGWATTTQDKSWEAFISGQNAMPETVLVPNAPIGSEISVGSLSDHLGIPTGTYNNADTEVINVMPHIAYHMIWNDYYRDENLETNIDYGDTQWIEDLPRAPLKLRAWEKDYFTSAWPWAQKGVASAATIDVDPDTGWHASVVTGQDPATGTLLRETGTGDIYVSDGGTPRDVYLEGDLHLDISELRRANKFQLWMERTARAGSRLTEFLKGHFGVWPRDERLQRPEYIGGGVAPFIISDVTNTSGFSAATGTPDPTVGQPLPMGYMAGKGSAYGNSNMMYKKVDEHGYIMIIMSIRPEAVYYQGLPRMFSKKVYLDFPFPEFADLGEQAILNKEIFFKDVAPGAANDDEFGYQSRYSDYKFIPNSIHGTFRSSLEFWHMARKFTDTPDLNDDFIHIDEANDDLQRIFAVADVEHVYLQVAHRIECDRPLPFFNIPSLE